MDYNTTHPPRVISRILLQLASIIAELFPREAVDQITNRGRAGGAQLSGNPPVYEFRTARGLDYGEMPQHASWDVATAWIFWNLCETISWLMANEANKYLSGKGYHAHVIRCRPKAALCIIKANAAITLPNHAFVYIVPTQGRDPCDEWILDGTLPQFGWRLSARFQSAWSYFHNFIVLEPIRVHALTSRQLRYQRDTINSLWYFKRAKEIMAEVLVGYPWDGTKHEQEEATVDVLDQAWPLLRIAADEQVHGRRA
ncbi:hypothetical protein BDV96DRAFT_601403 [Lophiotrema nucula]|uniref:Uncharacterized protein n=1 Tax=Lophiotrema nucula TaxID=690887 RepID=A0A6A5Z2C0_9PLEO|nr:hypothetical protein BDV96DRAFT_601403 [Lophiotrema nucula]